jgi:CBS domain-containing protein
MRKETADMRPGENAIGKAPLAGVTVAQVMTQSVPCAHAGTKADVVASMMIDGFGTVPIVDDQQRLLGIVSEHDLLAALDAGRDWSRLSAADIMAANPYAVRPETDLATLVHVLRASDLIRVPVVDAAERFVGMVARRDILRAYLNRPAC